MIRTTTVRKLALSFPETDEHPHFDRVAFRVKKKIFATLDEKSGRVMVRLSPKDQSVYCLYDPSVIYPVPGAWGKGGATYIELKKVTKEIFREAMTVAYVHIAPSKLTAKFLPH